MPLKAVVFGLEGVLIKASSETNTGLASERAPEIRAKVRTLFDFLRDKGIKPIALSNRNWIVTRQGTRISVDEYLTQEYGEHKLYVAQRGDIPHKPTAACVQTLLTKENLQTHEVLMIGVSGKDMQTAINGKVLFLNAVWDRQDVEHGFVFQSPEEIQRFIDVFALKEHPWFYAIDEVAYYSMAPFSTMYDEYRAYSEGARDAAKRGTPLRHFFLNSLISSLYFSGKIQNVDYIACAPRHEQGYGNPAMDDVLHVAASALRKRYIPNLVIRHTTAPSERRERMARRQPNPIVQLNTIRLETYPLKSGNESYKRPLKLSGKTVLVIDDFCTNGYTLEACRLYLKSAGAKVISVSWLKTINTGYTILKPRNNFNPYVGNTFDTLHVEKRTLPYANHIVTPAAITELDDAFERYNGYP